jgi:formylglycine-generating enzyme required for sulfatase activity
MLVLTSRIGRLSVACFALLLACKPKTSAPQAKVVSSASPTASVALRAPKEAPLSGERVEIPGGEFFAGSVPGEEGRVPELEPRKHKVELGPYQIDRLAYPNDPAQKPKTGVTRDEAKRLCAERGGRLCTELEWERACKGPESELFASGKTWDTRCANDPSSCASGFEVLGMGALLEWTAGDVAGENSQRSAVLRGAAPGAAAAMHRCAARRAADSDSHADDIGFRCCAGAPNAAGMVEPKLDVTFKKTRIAADELAKLFAQDPATAELAKDIRFFKDPDSAETVVARGPGDRKGFTFGVAPLLWNPVAGAEFLLVTGRSGESTSFVAAFYVIGDNQYRLASSFILRNEPGPVAFAYDAGLRPRLHFSTCWGCPGETGKILFRKPERAVILQP